jgi:hypothetical protein
MILENLLFFNKKGDQYNFQFNGSYWEGSVLFPLVSEKLFEIEHIFIIEKFLEGGSNVKYGFPHSLGISTECDVIRTRWESDYDSKKDVSSIIYTYELGIDSELDSPVLVKTNNVEFYPESNIGDSIDSLTGLIVTDDVTSSSIQINVALNSDNEGIYDRSLILEDYTDPVNPITILKVSFHGEVEGEDGRLSVLLSNFGRNFLNTDASLLRETDIQEGYPDYLTINRKRKELLLTGESIFPYLGSYKSLFNAIKFFGYYDLRIKEYWLNIKTDSVDTLTPLQQNKNALNQLSNSNKATSSLDLISNFLKDENQGKYKHVEIYGKREDGTFGLKKTFEDIFPSKSYKKTSLFGLFYDLNRVAESGEEDVFGYPLVEDAFVFSPEEVLMKLFGLKERLKRDYLPLNARILDITGEGVYFNIYKTRGWVDQIDINEIKSGIEVDFTVTPQNGYIEDLRVFSIKPNQNSILYPNVDGISPGISYYGNKVNPYTNSQNYSINDIPLLNEAILGFYKDVEEGNLPKNLGDGDFDPPGYKLFSNGAESKLLAGCPVLLENKTFDLSWEEMPSSWNGINDNILSTDFDVSNFYETLSDNPGFPLSLSSFSNSISLDEIEIPNSFIVNIGTSKNWFKPDSGKNIFVRIESSDFKQNLILGYVDDNGYNTLTGDLTVNPIYVRGSGTYSSWTIIPTNLTSDSYNFNLFENWVHKGGFYSWDRIKYLDFYEIEWTIYKEDAKPYYFQIRGNVEDLEKLPHFLPYTGKYNVKCRLWDTMNSISLGIKRSVIEVTGRSIELNSLTRYRKSELYDWNNMPLKWETYDSQWIFPVENNNNKNELSDAISNFPEYGNNFNEGQECEVLTLIPEIKSTVKFDLGLNSVDIIDISSSGGSYGIVTTNGSHGYLDNQNVWIYKSDGTPYGNFPIKVLGPNSFQIPTIVIPTITGGYCFNDGNIKIIIDGKKYVDCDFKGDLSSTASLIYYTLNNSNNNPKYKIISLVDSTVPDKKTITIQAPDDSGELWNGKTVQLQTSGSINTDYSTVSFTGGANEKQEYISYDFTSLPKGAMKYWGSKNISWDTFEDFQFSKAYAHSWDMMDYHNDWLGGFDMYSLQYGDKIKIGKDSEWFTIGEYDSPSNVYLDLEEVARQLNDSNDKNISKFHYTVRGYSKLSENYLYNGNSISPDLSTLPGPKNIEIDFYKAPEYSPLTFEPTDVAWDGDGDVWVTGEDVVKFDGTNYVVYNSSNSVVPGTGILTNVIIVDRNDEKWIGIDNNMIPLVKINDLDHTKSLSYSVDDFVDNSGTPVCPSSPGSVKVIEINSNNGDIFAHFSSSVSSYTGLLYYDSMAKSWNLYTTSNSDILSNDIRDIKLEFYEYKKWYLWVTTSSGISRFDGVGFRNYTSSNSGLPSDDIYSIEIDRQGNKWIGTDNGLVYWDRSKWKVWNNSTNPEISNGKFLNIIETGNSNIWFMIDPSSSSGNTELYFFDGYNFVKNLYRNDGTTLINPKANYYGKSILSAPWKVIKDDLTIFPKNIVGLTETGEIFKIDYIIPHIHAQSKFSGMDGWNFIYHESSSGLKLDSVDKYSWYKPIWNSYSIDYLKDQFPSLNLDDVFLYAPLRDILNKEASKEEYWKNPPIERILSKKSRSLLNDFEWVVSISSVGSDEGVKTVVDREGDVVLVGNFTDTIFMGSPNNISSQDVYLNSLYRSVFVAKYNKSGIIQWAKKIEDLLNSSDMKVKSVTTDNSGNIYVASYNTSLNGFMRITKYNASGDLLNEIDINSNSQFISDIKVDKYENIYISGSFKTSLVLGGIILSSTASNSSGFIAKIDSTLNFIWGKSFDSTGYDSVSYELAILKEEFVYVTGIFDTQIDLGPLILNSSSSSDMFIGKFYTGTGECLWAKSFSKDSLSLFDEPSICIDPKGHVLLTGSFQGTIKLEDKSLDSFVGGYDIFIVKLLSTGKLVWMKMCGGSSGDKSFDIESDSEENIYISGYFSGKSYFSPESIDSMGGNDIYLSKFDKYGNLIDIVTAGGTNNDVGSDLVMDNEENIYLTGYYTGNSDFSPFEIDTPISNQSEAFLGKIPKTQFIKGKNIGNIQSWSGSHSWSWSENKFYKNEFEIPLASTVFINPIDSLIPGKKNHVWILSDTEKNESIVKIRKSPYFIWTFTKEGFYDISCQLEDANGNVYQTEHKGKIKVIDHKNPKAGDLIPEIVNPNDYLIRTNYYGPEEIGFPSLSKI